MKAIVKPILKPNEFPQLMISGGQLIVLFTEKGCGVVVQNDSVWEIGYYSTNWVMLTFEKFNGEITLSN